MTKYIVKKAFVDDTGKLWTIGEELSRDTLNTKMPKTLLEYGFIEEIKEDTRWRANSKNPRYYYISGFGDVEDTPLISVPNANYIHEYGNYFKSRETAEKVAEAMKLLFGWLHDNDTDESNDLAYQPGKSMVRLSQAMDAARRAVLADDKGGE